MKYIIVTALFSFYLNAFSQDCTQEMLAEKPGKWKAGRQGSVSNVSPTDLAREKAVLGSIHKMIQENYTPTGCEISYSTVYGKSLSAGENWIADPYHYAMYLLRYLCDGNSSDKSKYYTDASTPTTVNITANVIYALDNLYAADLPSDDVRGYLKLKERPVQKDGYFFMGEEKVNYNSPIYEYRWLITYSDTLPFSYLSRKEYLEIQRKRLEKDIKDNPGEKSYLDQYLKNIDRYLNSSEEDLTQAAICNWNEEQRFEKFVEEGSKGSFIAVRPNLDYYRKSLPKSAPQFFTVVFKVSRDDAVFVNNIQAIEKAVDFAGLKSMLGK